VLRYPSLHRVPVRAGVLTVARRLLRDLVGQLVDVAVAHFVGHAFTARSASALCRSTISSGVQAVNSATWLVRTYGDFSYTLRFSSNPALRRSELSLASMSTRFPSRFAYWLTSSSEMPGQLSSGLSGRTCSRLMTAASSSGRNHGACSPFAARSRERR
jgi:hypothetical protein